MAAAGRHRVVVLNWACASRYERAAGLDAVLSRVEELSARTVIFDIEPLVAYWDSGQDALERGIALLALRPYQLLEVHVVCFATNSMRRPQAVPASARVRVVYLASAGKPMRIAPYQGFPGQGLWSATRSSLTACWHAGWVTPLSTTARHLMRSRPGPG